MEGKRGNDIWDLGRKGMSKREVWIWIVMGLIPHYEVFFCWGEGGRGFWGGEEMGMADASLIIKEKDGVRGTHPGFVNRKKSYQGGGMV